MQKITPQLTVLDVVSRYRQTQKVFREYDKLAGECICCKSLFCTLEEVAQKYGIELDKLLDDLMAVVEGHIK
ncbi:hypothetical protein [Desulfovulcanus sp.]